MKNKLFTKSAFKIALECPRRLYYRDCRKKNKTL